jgi:hypothetical protein
MKHGVSGAIATKSARDIHQEFLEFSREVRPFDCEFNLQLAVEQEQLIREAWGKFKQATAFAFLKFRMDNELKKPLGRRPGP